MLRPRGGRLVLSHTHTETCIATKHTHIAFPRNTHTHSCMADEHRHTHVWPLNTHRSVAPEPEQGTN